MSNKTKTDELVLTLPLTFKRTVYPALTPVDSLPEELQKIAKSRKIIGEFSDVVVEEKNPDFKKKFEKSEAENLRLRNENVALREKVEHYEKELKKTSGKDKK